MKAECYELLGDIEYQDVSKDFQKAIDNYLLSAKANPDNVDVYIKSAKTHEKRREFEESITLLKKALRRDPRHFVANYRIGLCHIRNDNKNDGLKFLNVALSINPNDGDVLLKLGEIYLRDDDTVVQAKDMIRNVLRINPESPEAHILMGRISEKQENHDIALEHFKKGLQYSLAEKVQADYKKSILQSNFYLGCQYERAKDIK
jgi:tetratricopeptide (TPR) repeat protein